MQEIRKSRIITFALAMIMVSGLGARSAAASPGCHLAIAFSSASEGYPTAATPAPIPDGLSAGAKEQIKNMVERLIETLEGASKHGSPTPGVSPLFSILLHFDDLGCGGIAALLHRARTDLSLRKFDKETGSEIDQAKNTEVIQRINEILAKLAEACDEHYTTEPKPPQPPADPPIKVNDKQDADSRNIEKLCDKDGTLRDDIKTSERRLDTLLSTQPRDENLIKHFASKLSAARAQLCPCLNSLKHTAQIAGDKGLENELDEMIAYYCKSPSWLTLPSDSGATDDKSGSIKEKSSTVPPVKTPALGEGAFKSIQPGPEDEAGKGQVAYAPPVAGPGSTILTTVTDPNEEGPHGVVITTVDDTGKRNYYQGVTNAMGQMKFAIPLGITAFDIVELLKGGKQKSLSHTDVGAPAHIPNTEPIPPEQIPSHGPAITEVSKVVERSGSNPGTVVFHTQGIDPYDTQVFANDQPVRVLAASNDSVVGGLSTGTPSGPSNFSVMSGGARSNLVRRDVAEVYADGLAPMRTGSKTNAVVHVDGVPPEDQPMVHFEVSGAGRLANGAASAEVPVKNGVARVAIQGVHPGQVVVNFQLLVTYRGNNPSVTRLGKNIRPADYTVMDGIVRDYLRKQGENPDNWSVTSKNPGGGLTYTSSNGANLNATFDRGQIVIQR